MTEENEGVKISSNITFIFKKIFPIFWFGICGVIFLTSVFANIAIILGDQSYNFELIIFLIFPPIMALFGYIMMKYLVLDMVDEAYDFGSYLLLKNKKQDYKIDLKNIRNVNYAFLQNPPKVILSLKEEIESFGKEISFAPKISFIPLKKNPLIEDLINRIDEAKSA